jgi:N12 class adenine-specific DNA methylase
MSCDGHRHDYFERAAGYAPGISAQDLEDVYDAGCGQQATTRLATLKADSKTRLLFADMEEEGIQPPTHSPTGLPKEENRPGYAAVFDFLTKKGYFDIEGRGQTGMQTALEADCDMSREIPQERIDDLANQNLAGVRLCGMDEEDTRHAARFPVWQYIPRCAKCGRFMATQNPVCQNPKCGMAGKKQQDPIDWPPAGANLKKAKQRPADWEANRTLPKAHIRIRDGEAEKDVLLERVSADRTQIEYSDGEQTGTVERGDVTQWEGQAAKPRRRKRSGNPATPPPAIPEPAADPEVPATEAVSVSVAQEAQTGDGSDTVSFAGTIPSAVDEVVDDGLEPYRRAAMDWKYLTVASGGVASEDDLNGYLIAQFGLSEETARSVASSLDGRDHFSVSAGGVIWNPQAAGRPVPHWSDHPELAPPAPGSQAGAKLLQKCPQCGQFAGDDHVCPATQPEIEAPTVHHLAELAYKAKDAWQGNVLEDGEFIADGFILVRRSAVKRERALKTLAKTNPNRVGVSQASGKQIIETMARASRIGAEICGYRPEADTHMGVDVAYLLAENDDVIGVNAHKLSLIHSGVTYDRITVPDESRRKKDGVVFWNGDEAVALLMPLQITGADQLDAATLRQEPPAAETSTPPPSDETPGPGSQKCPKCGQFMSDPESHVCPATAGEEPPTASAPVTPADDALEAVEAALDSAVANPIEPSTETQAVSDPEPIAAVPAKPARKKKRKENFGYKSGEGSAYTYIPKWMDIPGIGETEKDDNPQAVLKFFTPDANWSWYVTEYDSHDLCFGLVEGMETEWGYFSLSEISATKGPLGLKIERDKWFAPQPVKQLPAYRQAFGGDETPDVPVVIPMEQFIDKPIAAASAADESAGPGAQKCPKCGQFMGDPDAHVCPVTDEPSFDLAPTLDDSLSVLPEDTSTPSDADPSADPFYVPDNEPLIEAPRGPDYVITDADELGKGGAKTKARNNIAAIKLVKQLEAEGRMATPEEQAVLVKFVGWGGLPGVFDYKNEQYKRWPSYYPKPEFYDQWLELKELLTKEEWEAAANSTLNAHYTSATVVRGVWKALAHMGFDRFKGNVLEPAAGIGHFFGCMPDEYKGCHKMGVELDAFTARIAKHLYQNANIENSGFEDTNLPDNFFDLAISNVPFGNYGVTDREFRGPLRFLTRSIHNFFFAKSLRKVKPGGVVAFVTSRYTLDSQDPAIREHMAKEADLVGAIRLPNTAFKENAGTEVTTDILFLRKRGKGEPPSGADWVNTRTITGDDGSEIRVNGYFADHPDMMLGKLTTGGSMYGNNEVTLESDGRDLATALDDAISRLPDDALKAPAGHCGMCGAFLSADGECNNPNCHSKQALTKTPRMAERGLKENEYVVKDGQVLRVRNGQLLSPDDDAFDEVDEKTGKARKPKRDTKTMQRIQGLIEINAAARSLLARNVNQMDDAALAEAQAQLNQAYDAFIAEHGCISGDANKRALKNDPNLPFLLALEDDYDTQSKSAKKAAIFSKRTIAINKAIEQADSPQDALRVVLGEGGTIHWERMSHLTGKPVEQLQRALRLQGAVFQTPEGDWQAADEYLSGNVRQKLDKARAAAAIDARYQANVEALKAVLPRDLEAGEIKARLGSAWIPPDDVAEFANYLLEANFEVEYNPTMAEWSVEPTKKASNKAYWVRQGEFQASSARNTKVWGSPRAGGLELLKKTLNAQQATFYDTDADGKKTMNQEATLAAREMQAKIAKEFEQWIFSDPSRAERLLRKYNDTFNSEVPRDYDGSHLTLPGLGATMPQLRKHQLDNIWRITQGDNTLLAHMVGAGKTFTMIGGGMELRRMGLRKKVMYAVPNHMLEQFAADIYRMYPAANVLTLATDDLTPEKRAETMSRVATGDYDAVVVTHSAFGKIPVAAETQTRYLREQLDELNDALEGAIQDGEKISVKNMQKAKKKLEERIKAKQLEVEAHQDSTVTWDDLGVDQLFVDEADLYKNLDFPTRRNVAGIKGRDSQRAFDMYTKIRAMGDKFGHGKGVCFATGTPIANSVSEMYNMQRYLDHHHLVDQGIAHFDAWANQFGEVVTSIEMKPSGGGYQTKERFAQFNNVPELKRMFMRFADIRVDPEELKLPRPQLAADEKGDRRQRGVVAPASPVLKTYIQDLVKRADNLGSVSPREDNMLKITGDGRKAALDMRLVDPLAEDEPDSKLNACVRSVFDTYEKTTGVEVEGMEGKHNMAQIVFCDLGTPAARERGEFCVYDDIKAKLVNRGIPAEEIAFMQDCKDDAAKFELFQRVNSGQVRVLIGSTETMGSGMNAQRRMAALHHLDAPWRPRDIEQREGRILRQGNLNKEVQINRYLTAESFDVYNWQQLERKQRFISQVMNRSLNERNVEDIDAQALTYAEMKALATGNPAVIEKVAVDTELRKLEALEKAHKSSSHAVRVQLDKLPKDIAAAREVLAGAEKAQSAVNQAKTAESQRETQLKTEVEQARTWAHEAAAKAKAEDTPENRQQAETAKQAAIARAERFKRNGAFRIRLNDRDYDEKDQAGHILADIESELMMRGGGGEHAVGEYLGFPLIARAPQNRGDKCQFYVKFTEQDARAIPEIPNLARTFDSTADDSSNINRLRRTLDIPEKDIAANQNRIATLAKDLENLQRTGGGEFEHAERLGELRQRAKELDEIMASYGKETQVLASDDEGGGDEG